MNCLLAVKLKKNADVVKTFNGFKIPEIKTKWNEMNFNPTVIEVLQWNNDIKLNKIKASCNMETTASRCEIHNCRIDYTQYFSTTRRKCLQQGTTQAIWEGVWSLKFEMWRKKSEKQKLTQHIEGESDRSEAKALKEAQSTKHGHVHREGHTQAKHEHRQHRYKQHRNTTYPERERDR